MPQPEHGWQLLQLAELMQTIEHHTAVALRALHEIDGEMAHGTVVTIDRLSVEDVSVAVGELAQLIERVEQLADTLPAGDVDISYDELAAAAARDLADGILDADRAHLAARVLHVDEGWPALGDGLRGTDAHTAWRETTLAELLGAFRGATPELVREAATAAGLATDAEIATCEHEAIATLAARLDGRR